MDGQWGRVGSRRWGKAPIRTQGQCCTFSMCHELIQSTREAQTAVRSSLVPHAVLLTHPRTMKCTLVVSQHRQKAVCKSRPGNLLSSAWCFWIVHECAYHIQAKDGFQFLCLYGRFSKIRSHLSPQVGPCFQSIETPQLGQSCCAYKGPLDLRKLIWVSEFVLKSTGPKLCKAISCSKVM